MGNVSFLLPHEVLHILVQDNDLETLCQQEGLDEVTGLRRNQLAEQLGTQHLIVLSFWGDSVPVSWDRSESVSVCTYHLPGLSDPVKRRLRIPFVVVPKAMCAPETNEAILSLFGWSLGYCKAGVFPQVDHLGQAFTSRWRLQLSGVAFPWRALCLEVLGDWEYFANTLSLPHWQSASQVCFRCDVHKDMLRDCSLEADWRQPEHRLSHDGLIAMLGRLGRPLCPVWGWPNFHSSHFRLDWLHICDLGITAYFLGSLFVLFLKHREYGRILEHRRQTLWDLIQAWYQSPGQRANSSDRLKNLPFGRFRGRPPCLKAQGATVRRLVGFGLALVQRWDDDDDDFDEEHRLVKGAMQDLHRCYDCLREGPDSLPLDELRLAASNFGLKLVALNDLSADDYAVPPKLHQFQELAMEGCRPSRIWLYRSEDFAGSLARMAHRRGGRETAQATSSLALARFCAKQPVPNLR